MKKTLVKFTSVLMSVAMLFMVTGCESKTDIEKKIETYLEFNRIAVTRNDEKDDAEIYYYVGENENKEKFYDSITKCNYDDFYGYEISIDGKYGGTFAEKHKDSEQDKGWIYLDDYTFRESSSEYAFNIVYTILPGIDFSGPIYKYDFEKNVEDSKEVYTLQNTDEFSFSEYIVTFEKNKISVHIKDKDDGKVTDLVATFDNVDENYYKISSFLESML